MKLQCKDCYITGVAEDSEKALNKALKKIKKFEEEGFVPAGRTDIRPIPITLPFEWSFGPDKDPNWRMQCHAWRMLDPYFVAYEISGNEIYLDSILQYIYDWWHWLEFRAEELGRAWYDMSVGLRSCKLAILYQWVKENKKYKKYVRMLNFLALSHIDNLLDWKNINQGNHGIFQSHGLKCLSKVGVVSDEVSDVAILASNKYLKKILHEQFDEEGVHQEGSFEYHRFAIDKFSSLVSSPVWGEDVSFDILRVLKKAESNYYWMVFPDGFEVSVGDSGGKFVGTTRPPKTLSKIWCASSGYNVYKNENSSEQSYLLFVTKNKDQIHGHDDFGSLVLWENGRSILIDPGKYGYVKNSLRKYIVSSSAHNVSRFNRVGFNYADALVRVDYFKEFRGNIVGALVVCNNNESDSSFAQSRFFIYCPKKYLYVIDEFESANKNEIEVNWHVDDGVSLVNGSVDFSRDSNALMYSIEEVAGDLEVTYHEMDYAAPAGISAINTPYMSVASCKTVKAKTIKKKCKIESFFFLSSIYSCESRKYIEHYKLEARQIIKDKF